MIAIHHRIGSYSDKWIEYCENSNIKYLVVDIFNSDVIYLLRKKNASHLLFHFGTEEYRTDLILKNLCLILEKENINIFPSFSSYWHYDDKLSQKYLFEHLEIPHAPMKVFYSRKSAMKWVNNHEIYPFVFKLRGGSGSRNVKLVQNRGDARKLIKKMFGNGIKPVRSLLNDVGTKVRKHNKKNDWNKALLRLPKTVYRNLTANRFLANEKGYFLVQDYYPDNKYDTRVVIIGEKAFALRRYIRPNDFRASGSGLIDLAPTEIDRDMIAIAFDVADKIGSISAAFDFIYDSYGSPKILEVSFCYSTDNLAKSDGYWDRSLKYHEDNIVPEYEIIKSVIF